MSDEKQKSIVTGIGHLWFVELVTPTVYNNELAYRIQIVFDKEQDWEAIEHLKQVINAAMSLKFGGKAPRVWHNPLKDGDHTDDPNLMGKMFLRAKRPYDEARPDRSRVVIVGPGSKSRGIAPQAIPPEDVYSGCWGRLNIWPGVYERNPAKNIPHPGVTILLNGVQKVYDGEPLGSGQAVEFDAVDVDEDNPTAFE